MRTAALLALTGVIFWWASKEPETRRRAPPGRWSGPQPVGSRHEDGSSEGNAPAPNRWGVVHGVVETQVGGSAISMARVSLRDEIGPWPDRITRTDSDGAFRIPSLPLGKYSITVRADGYEARWSTVTVGVGDVELTIPLRRSREMEVLFKNIGQYWRDRCVVVHFEPRTRSGVRHRVRLRVSRRTTLEAPPPGDYIVTLSDDAGPLLLCVYQSLVVTADEVPSPTIRLPGGARVRGSIRLPNGRCYSKGRVGLDPDIHVLTDDWGVFECPFVPEGTCEVRISSGTGLLYVAWLSIPGTGSVQCDIQVVGTGSVRATVRDALHHTSFALLRVESGKRVALLLPEDGVIRMNQLEAGDYRLQDFGPPGIEFAVAPWQDVDLGEISCQGASLHVVERHK